MLLIKAKLKLNEHGLALMDLPSSCFSPFRLLPAVLHSVVDPVLSFLDWRLGVESDKDVYA